MQREREILPAQVVDQENDDIRLLGLQPDGGGCGCAASLEACHREGKRRDPERADELAFQAGHECGLIEGLEHRELLAATRRRQA